MEIGDLVEVVQLSHFNYTDEYIGKRGVVTDVCQNKTIRIQWSDNGKTTTGGRIIERFRTVSPTDLIWTD